MQRKRRQKGQQTHLCLLVNENATHYHPEPIQRFTALIRGHGGQYTVLRPGSGADLLDTARAACGLKRGRQLLPQQFDRRGKITGLVACGGDGTFNLVSRAAMVADLPAGALPMGRFNNIAMSLYGSVSPNVAMDRIVSRAYRKIDSGTVAGQPFFGSIGLGLVTKMAGLLEGRKRPRFALGWSRLGGRAATEVAARKTIIKVDSFRFEVTPVILNVNLLPYTLGLPLTPASLFDDSRAEVIFDVRAETKLFTSYVRLVSRKKYVYGRDVRMFRGSIITLQPTRGRTLYLDGELVPLPDNVIEIRIGEKQLKVFC